MTISHLFLDAPNLASVKAPQRQTRSLLEAFNAFIEKQTLQSSSLQAYARLRNAVEDFLNARAQHNIDVRYVDLNWIADLKSHLCIFYSEAAVMKQLHMLKRVLEFAGNKPEGFKPGFKKAPLHLNQEEIVRILTKRLGNEQIINARDLFLFQCCTGLSYLNMRAVTPNAVSGDQLHLTNTKPSKQAPIPLNGIARKILEKHNCVLPVVSRQKLKQSLRQLSVVCCISTNLSMRIARNTFVHTPLFNMSDDGFV